MKATGWRSGGPAYVRMEGSILASEQGRSYHGYPLGRGRSATSYQPSTKSANATKFALP